MQQIIALFFTSGTTAIIGNFLLKSGVNRLGSFNITLDKLPATIWQMLTNWQIVVGFILYGLSSLLYLKLIKITELSRVYPPLTAYMVFAVLFLGIFFLHEAMTFGKILGTALIIAGIFAIYH